MGRFKAGAMPARKHGFSRGFTLIEILAVIAIISLLIAILSPTTGRARRNTQLVLSANNMRRLYQGIVMYAADNNSQIPYANIDNGQLRREIWTGASLIGLGLLFGEYIDSTDVYYSPAYNNSPYLATKVNFQVNGQSCSSDYELVSYDIEGTGTPPRTRRLLENIDSASPLILCDIPAPVDKSYILYGDGHIAQASYALTAPGSTPTDSTPQDTALPETVPMSLLE